MMFIEQIKMQKIVGYIFYCWALAGKFPDSIRLIEKEDHDVANHCYSHLKMTTIRRL